MSEDLVKKDPSLSIRRGWYYDHLWNSKEEHWWCVNTEGEIVDPTKAQFPTNGHGDYEEFKGVFDCEQCGKEIMEEDVIQAGRFPVCSNKCYGKLVGVF